VQQTEVIKLIGLCTVNYRNWPEPGKEEMLMTLWTKMLADVDFEVGQAAIEKHLVESVYPPTIADIRARIADITVIREKTGIEAWGEVKNAIRRYGTYREEDAMKSMGGVTQKVVEAIGFRTLCLSENEMADRAHFLKVYDVMANRERQDALLPDSTRAIMQRLQERRTLSLPYEEDYSA
jgi:Loader and inhibitor of phage G40P.